MGLVDLKTDLKNLKFGSDRPGGGSSGQPYIQTAIPSSDLTSNILVLNPDTFVTLPSGAPALTI